MSLVLVAPPTNGEEPISLEEAMDQLRVEDDSEAAHIESLIRAARGRVETETGRALLSQQWQYIADAFPECNGVIKLGKSPLISVESIKYIDANGVLTTLATNQYVVDTAHVLGRVAPAYSVSWPYARPQLGAVQVNFTAGYTDASLIPADLIAALKLILGELYENREASVDSSVKDNPHLLLLLDPWRLPVI